MLTREYNKDLTHENTFGMKVLCACYLEYDSLDDLMSLEFDSLPKPVKHIGAGSNLLFTSDFTGTVLHSAIKFIRIMSSNEDSVLVEVGSGVCFDEFIEWSCLNGYWGVENLSLIPGEVGASAVQNIGAYGVEVKDVIVRVTCFDTLTRDMVVFENSDCRYGYRDSVFKSASFSGRYIVTSVLFSLSTIPSPELDYGHLKSALAEKDVNNPMVVRTAVIAIRKEKLPDPAVLGSAGSFFKNPIVSTEQFLEIVAMVTREKGADAVVPHYCQDGGVKIPAGWMIDYCGFKGCSSGGASVYEKQALVIVNRSGNATPEDIITLETRILAGVKEKFGVDLHPEVEHI